MTRPAGERRGRRNGEVEPPTTRCEKTKKELYDSVCYLKNSANIDPSRVIATKQAYYYFLFSCLQRCYIFLRRSDGPIGLIFFILALSNQTLSKTSFA